MSAFTTALSVWASFVTVLGALAGFVALASGRAMAEAVEQSHHTAIAAVPGGFLVAVGVGIAEIAT